MPHVHLREPLKRLAGNRSEHALEGGDGRGGAGGARARPSPALDGWILDERDVLRRHINVFVNGELRRAGHAGRRRRPARHPAGDLGRMSADMTELLVGTKKGLFVLEGEPGAPFEVTARAFAGEPVEYALRDPRSGRLLASVTSPFYGPKLWYTDDPAGEWEQAQGVALPEGGDAALERIWVIVAGEADGTIYAGGDPGRAVREPRRRRELRAQPRAVGAPDAAEVDAGRRRAVPALDRDLAGRAGPPRGGDLRRRACG